MSKNSGVGAVHPQLEDLLTEIETTEDAVEGDVRSEDYVPPFTGMSAQSYEKYLKRAAYFNLIERTLQAIIGAMVRKDYVLDGSGTIEFDEAYSMEDGLIETYDNILTTGRCAYLWDPTPDMPRRVVQYDSDDILNWGNGFVVLDACRLVSDPQDPFSQVEEERRLVLSLGGSGATPVYTMQYFVWRGTEQAGQWVPESDPIVPQFRGKPLNFIPLISITPSGLTLEPSKPVLYTLATLNIQHFNLCSTIAYGARFFALPKPYIAGDFHAVNADGTGPTTITLGQEDVLLLKQGGQAGFMEFTNSGGMKFLADERQKLEDQMVMLGSRMLTQKAGVESVDAMSLRLATETAVLVAIVKSVEAGLNTLLEWMAAVDGKQATISLNKDLAPESLSPQQVEALLKSLAAGAITVDQLLQRFYESEFVAPPDQQA